MGKGKDAKVLGGYGRGMDNKKPRSVKRQHDRIVDKRRRRIGKKECADRIMEMGDTDTKENMTKNEYELKLKELNEMSSL